MKFRRIPIEVEAYHYQEDFKNAPEWVKNLVFVQTPWGTIQYDGHTIHENTYFIKYSSNSVALWDKESFLIEFEEV